MSGIGVVVNPLSRRNLRDPDAKARLARKLGDHGVVREARSIDELHRVAEDFKRQRIDVLGISGGDGTNHVTITGFLKVYDGMALPHFAFLRGGTMNTVANSVGIPQGGPEGLLGRLIRSYVARASLPLENVERHVMRIGHHGGGDNRSRNNGGGDNGGGDNYGFLFGSGVVAGFLAEYYRSGQPSPLVAAKTLVRGIGSALTRGEMIQRMAKPFNGEVELGDGTRWERRDYLSVAAGTIDQIGLNFRPFYRFDERPEHFHMLGIYTTPVGFCRELPRVWRAEAMRPGKTHEAVAKRAIVRSADGIVRYMIDGDLHVCKGDLTIEIGPRVKIIVVK